MKKIIYTLFLLLTTLTVCLAFTGCEKETEITSGPSVQTTENSSNESKETKYEKSLTKDHTVIFKGQVDPRIKVNKLAFNVVLYNEDNDKTYTITFFPGSNYIVRENLPQGRYYSMSCWIQGDDTDEIDIEMQGFEFETKTQTTEVNYTFGDIHYSGEIKNYNYIDGMIDREGTDKIRAERGLDPIDWNKVDKSDKVAKDSKDTKK